MIIFFGPPGSGKSVQGELLVERNNWYWLSTGQLFRNTGNKDILSRLATGELINDDMTNQVVSDALSQAKSENRVVLDGYPRNRNQAKWLAQHLPSHNREIQLIIEFQVSKEELIRRLSGRGRDEDKLEVIEKRLNIYHQNTQPVLNYYREQGISLKIINGEGKVDIVHERIQKAVEECLPE